MALTFRYSIFRKQLLLVLAALTSFVFSIAQNAIVTENALTGNPSSEWDIVGAGDLSIQGFATDISVNKGQTVHFKINTDASAYSINIYRLGYYNGNGARHKGTGIITAALPQTQPAPLTNSTTGLVDCGNWNESAHWDVPSTAISGIYIAVLKRTDNGGASHIIFIVRDDASHSDLFFQTSDATWQAYNVYGGNSSYVGTTALPNGHASKISYNRPFVTRDGGGGGGAGEDWVFNAEYPMLRFLEKNGYDVTYTTNIDADRYGSLILNHKVFLSVGHDEYWSGAQKANVTAARDAGVHLAFFSGNEVYWKTRWENSTDPSNTPYRTLVCYKEGTLGENVCGGKCDPSTEWTGLFRDGCQFPAGGGCSPENALTGQISWVGSTGAIKVPSAYKNFRFWRNTSIATMGSGSVVTLPIGTLGYEWDQEQYPDSYPHGRIILSSTTLSGKTHKLSLYRHSSGALVFGAGTVQWAWGLDDTHDRGSEPASADMQQATINLFADMGVQPSTIEPGRIASPQSTDTQAPLSTITSPAHNSSVPAYSPVTITGTTTDAFAVAGVEVSVDGGATWQLVTGTTSWSFSWIPAAPGTYIIKARGFDDSGNMEVPGVAGSSNNITITVTTGSLACPCLTIFQPTDAPVNFPTNSGQAIETGVKFRTTQNGGYITGIRFYKNAASTGTHKGHLWNNYTGEMLAEATFTDETSSGWQQVLFANPVAISTNTTYVASYHSSSGHYTSTYPYFTQATVNGPLRALANGEDGVNGVFIQSTTPALPVNSFQSANYWVDVVYVLPDFTPPLVSFVSPVNNAAGVNINTAVTATFNEAIDAATITSTTFELRNSSNVLVPATVSYNAGTKTATLTPTSALADMSLYTATLKGGSSGIKDIAGYALVADYSWTFSTPFPAPVAPTEGKGGPILVISSSTNPFSRYAVEILRAEGLSEFDALDISAVNASVLNNYDVVVLGEMTVNAAQVTMFTDWTNAGGTFIAFKPHSLLAPLLGITAAGSSLSDKYLLVNTVSGPGVGIVNQTIQYHGSADLYTLTGGSGSTSLATLYSSATTATSNPAVTTRSVGANGGTATAFTYDLAKSIIYTRQGNPAWSGTSRDGQPGPIRSDNLFFGNAAGDPQPDWIDLNKVAIPQADEQQRLLANIIIQGNLHRKPLPRLWYLPKGLKAAIIMTGDDHANNGTEDRFNQYMTLGPNTPQDVANWTSIRGTSYIFPNTPISNTQASAFQALGFEIALHPNTNCTNYTLSSLENNFASQLGTFYQAYPGLSTVVSNRTHCLPWSDWASQPKAEFNHGMRLDVNYYYWPGSWIQNRPGMFTGSGLPMRFADLDGTLIDVYQAPTQMTDESGISNMANFCDQLLDKAIGAEGYYGTFCANMHTDDADSPGSDAIIASALARQIPVISAKQMLTWLDARNNTFFGPMTWSNNQLGFSVTAVVGANNLKAMLPLYSGANQLISITRNGSSIPFTTQTIKGIQYAFFDVTIGYSTFVASYSGSPSVTTHPLTQTICSGNNISFSSAATGTPAPSVQWQESTNGTVWTNVSGAATNSTLTFTATIADNNKQYRAVWTNSAGSVNSNPATLTVNPTPAAPTVNVVNNCGNSELTAGNFTGTLLWSTGETTSAITVSAAGTYTVTQTVGACTSVNGSGVAAPNQVPSAPTVTVVNNCGNSVLTAGNYTGSLLWRNGETTSSITVTNAAAYTVSQTVNGCTSVTGSGTSAPKVIPSAPVVTVVNNCGSSVITASSFAGSLLWSNGATSSFITVTDAATYTVTQTSNGCTSAAGSGVSAPKAIPSAPVVTVVNNCGNAVLTADNYTGTLLWSTGETTSSITVTNAATYTVSQIVNGCASASGSGTSAPKAIPSAPSTTVVNNCGNSVLTAGNYTGTLLWSTGQTTSSITVATGGTYTVTQTVNGCASATGSGVAAPKSIPSAPTVTVVDNCGNSVITASGFTGSLLWSNGATTPSITVTNAAAYSVTQTVNGCVSPSGSGISAPKAIPAAPSVSVRNNCGNSALTAGNYTGSLLWSTEETASSITVSAAGTYFVTQISLNGCSSIAASAIVTPLRFTQAPTITAKGPTTFCQGGTVKLSSNAKNGNVWSTGETTQNIIVSTSGIYTVTFTGENGCTSGNSIPVVVTVNPIPAAPIVTVADNCGNSVLTASNYSGTLLWSNEATTSSITVSAPASYTVKQTVNGCKSNAGSGTAAPKLVPSAPSAAVVNNCGNSLLTAGNYTGALVWNTGETTSSITVISSGTYTVTQTIDGCTSAEGSAVAVPKVIPSAPIITPGGATTFCTGGAVVLTSGAASGNQWYKDAVLIAGETGVTYTATTSGSYRVTTTSGDCISAASSEMLVTVNTLPTAAITNDNGLALNCTIPTTTLTATGGVSYLWSTGATTASITVNTAGTFTVTVTGANGCTATAVATTTLDNTAPTANISNDNGLALNCTIPNTILTATGGVSYLWSTGATTASITVSTAGTFTVTVTGANGCIATASATTTLDNTAPIAGINTPATTVLTCAATLINITATGGGTYSWSNGTTVIGTDATLAITAAGTYTVTVTSANGCTDVESIVITQDGTVPTASITNDNGLALNCTIPTTTLTATGGVSYLWSTGATTASITVSTAGTFTVTVTGANGCTATASATTTLDNTAPIAAITNDNGLALNCTIPTTTLTATGGVSYLWSTGATTASITVSTAGTFTVTVTGANGCTATASATTTLDNTAPTAAITNDNGLALNCTVTSTTLTATGGVSYLWSTGATTASITVSTAGTFTVTVTGANGCTATTSATTTLDNTAPTAAITNDNGLALNCTIPTTTLTATGGVSYLWSTGATTASITVSTAGTFTVTVTGANGCIATASATTTLDNTAPIAGINTPATTVLTCAATLINITATGGGTYSWSNGTTVIGTDATLAITAAGTYTVTVTSANGCTDVESIVITQDGTVPTASITNDNGLALNCTIPTTTLTATGGVSYLWSTGATTASITVSTAGTFTVTVTGANGCTATTSATTTLDNTAPTAAITNDNGLALNCTIPTTTLTATGGVSYLWSTGATTASITVSTAGTFTVTVTGANGCTATASATTTLDNTAPTAAITNDNGLALNCTIPTTTLTATGGVSYLWSTGATTASITVSTAGTFTVTVTGANGCTATASATTTLDNTAPIAAITNDNGLALNCTIPTTTLTATGGVSYLWSTGATTASITVSTAGTFTVTVTGANGCTATASATTTLDNTAPIAAITNDNGLALNCTIPTTTLTATGGVSYLWSTGATTASITVSTAGTFTVTVTGANGCTATTSATTTLDNTAPIAAITNDNGLALNCTIPTTTLTATGGVSYLWSTGATTASITVSTAGTFTVTVTGANGCTATASATTTLDNTAPTAAITNDNGLALNCTIPTTTLTATGGVSYLWSTGATTASITVSTAGTFTVTVTGANGCTATASATTTLDNTAPTAAITNDNGLALNCTIPTTTLTATGGVSYLWSTGATTASITVSTAGTFTVTVTGANGCTATASATTTLDNTAPIAAITNDNGLALNCTIPTTTLTATGGVSYLWSTGATTASITVSTAGTFTVTVTGANGCTATTSATTTLDNTAPIAAITNDNGLALNCTIPTTTLTATGGVSYLWSTGATTASITVSTAGTFTVTVTGANGCTATASATTTLDNTAPTAAITNDNGLALNCTIPTTTLTATGGVSYLWSTGATTASITVSTAGTFTVTVTGANGCTATTSATTTLDNTAPIAAITNDNGLALNCTIPTTTLTATGGVSYLWSTGATTASITVSTAGTFTVTVTGANGCTATASATTTLDNTAPTAAITNDNGLALNCTIPTTTLTATGGVSYLWSTGATTASITVSTAGTFTVTVTGANGCTATASATTTLNSIAPTITGTTAGSRCGTGTVIIGATASAGTINWYASATGGSSIGTGTSFTTPSIAATTSYWVDANDGCITAARTEVIATVNPLTAITVQPVGGAICSGSSINLAVIATGLNLHYQWKKDGTDIGTNTNTYSANTGGTYTVVVTGDCGVITSEEAIVAINTTPPAPTITAGGPLSFCQGGSVTLTSSEATGNTWSTGAATQSINVTATGSYTVTYTAANGCTSAASTATVITVNPLPTLTSSTSLSVYSGDLLSYTATSSPGDASLTWTRAVVSGITNPAGSGSGNISETLINNTPDPIQVVYVYTLTSSNGCVSTQNVTVTVNVPLPRIAATPIVINSGQSVKPVIDMTVMPNPATDYFNLVVRDNANNKNTITVRVLDIFGMVVEKHEKIAAGVAMRMGQTWAAGIYFVEVIQDGQRKVVKIIKAN